MLNESNIPLEEDGIEEEILVDEEVAITKAMWGDIGGNIENQTDLQNALDAKQDSLTEAQLNAVNSGITSEKVTTYDGYADQIASKADQSALNAESTARGEADTALGTRIDNEALARQSADNGLQSQIDAITSKSDVVDVVANYAALQAYDTSTLGNNDVVKVLDDETHEDALTYYRWSTTTQTWTYIGQEAPYYSKGQMDVKLAEKQDKLTAGTNIQIQNGTISATDTKYTNGNGLNLNGTEFSADTDVLATKEDLEGYYTKPETDNLLAPKLEAEVVAELPATGTEGKLYLTPKAHTTSTATGNPIEATVTAQAGQLESFQLDGDTFQQSYTGKNLYNKANYLDGVYINASTGAVGSGSGFVTIYAQISPSTQYTVSKLSTSRFIIAESSSIPAVGDTLNVLSATAQTSEVKTITTSANVAYLEIMVKSSSDTLTIEQILDSIQIEAGSQATSFEPFVGGQPSPSPDYPQQIQTVTGEQTVVVTGKNLFNKDSYQVMNAYFTTSTTTITSDRSNRMLYIACEPNTTYTVSKETGAVFNVGYTDSLPAIGTSVYGTQGGSSSPSQTLTTGANAKYLVCRFYQTVLDTITQAKMAASIQIEKGSTATTYAPYSKQTYPLDLGSIELCKLGTYQDYIYKDGEDWKIRKYTRRIDTDSSTSVITGAFGTNSYQIGLPDGIQVDDSIRVISDYFEGKSYNDRTAIQNNFVYMDYDQRPWAYIRNTSWASISAFQTWLGQNKPKFYYAATPTNITITDTDLIAQLEAVRTASLENGTNTITNTAAGSNLAGDMKIGYYGFNPTNRYDKFIWLNLNNNYEQIGS